MSNRFIFSLRYANKVFLKIMKVVVGFLFFMTLFRVNLYFLVVHFHIQNPDLHEVFQAFWVGLQQDILIYAYAIAPIVLILLLQAISEKWPAFLNGLYKTYLFFAWLIVSGFSFIDFVFYSLNQKRMHSADYMAFDLEKIFEMIKQIPGNNLLIFSTVTALLLVLGLVMVKEINFGFWKDEYSPNKGSVLEIIVRSALPILIVLGAAALDPEIMVSDAEAVRELALSPIWCFDK